MTFEAAYGLLALLWVTASLGGGLMLAFLARRMHPSLSLLKLWVFYSALLAVFAAVVMVIALT
jgi:hypothetical protein